MASLTLLIWIIYGLFAAFDGSSLSVWWLPVGLAAGGFAAGGLVALEDDGSVWTRRISRTRFLMAMWGVTLFAVLGTLFYIGDPQGAVAIAATWGTVLVLDLLVRKT
jgi:hypothetical protein